MATLTAAEIETNLRQANPVIQDNVNGVNVVLNQQQYDARIASWVAAELANQDAAAQQDALRQLRQQVRVARTRLQQIRDTTGTPTNAQRDQAIKDIATYLDGLIGVLIDLNIIERQ